MNREFNKLLKVLLQNKKINRQQMRTIRGQYNKGDVEGAKRGLKRLLNKNDKVSA